MDILLDSCQGLRRKAIAEKYGLTDLQVKNRLEYARKILLQEAGKLASKNPPPQNSAIY